MRSLFPGRVFALLTVWLACAFDSRASAEVAAVAGELSSTSYEARPPAVEEEWCLDLFARVSMERKGNVCLSPLSLNMAMGLVQEGSFGETRRDFIELTKTDDLLRRVSRLAGDLEARRDLEFVHGTVVAFDPQVRVASDWDQRLIEAGCPPSRILPLRREPHKAAAEINREVLQRTRGRIPVLVEPSSLGPSCFVCVGSALYARSRWASAFDRSRSGVSVFHGGDENIEAMFMRKILLARYGRRLRADVLALDYEAPGLRLYLILPDERLSLPIWLRRYSSRLKEVFVSLEWKNVRLSLPRFDIADSLSLNTWMTQRDADASYFRKGDFSRMGVWPAPQRLGGVVQRCRFTLDETGSEASAATGIPMLGCAAVAVHMPDLELTFDRPFLFFLVDESLREGRRVLFAGKIEKP